MRRIAIIENNIIATNTIRKTLTQQFINAGYTVRVLTTGTEEALQQARNNGFQIVDVKGSTQNPIDILKYMRNLKRALTEFRPDVCLTFTIRPAIWGNAVTRQLNIPTITNITGIGPLFERNNIPYRAARMLYKFILKKTAFIFFQNNDDKTVFLKNGFVKPEQCLVIPGSGVDVDFYKPMPDVVADVPFSFLFVSRLVKDKGILEFVAAATLLKNELNASFKVIGPVWSQNLKDNTVTTAEIQEWVDRGFIEYLGEQNDVRAFMAVSGCVVLPSYREGMSNVLLEASAMGKPCITTDTTGCRDIVEEGVNGFLCNVKDVESLAESMRKMYHLQENARINMGIKGREKVVRSFNKQTVVEAYLKAIEKVLNG
jgi:glycosyltransferase involved in cell wall biosynthesis